MRLTLLFLTISYSLLGQFVIPVQSDTLVPKFEVIGHGIADVGSTAVENAFLGKFFFGGNIDEGIKNASYGRHKSLNRIGADVQTELEFRNYQSAVFGMQRFGWLLRGGIYVNSGAVYTDDLFGLAFYGNERFLGQELSLTGSRGGAWSFRKIGLGVIDKKSKSNISLNAYSIAAYSQADLREVSLYQSEMGDSLSLRYHGFTETLIGSSPFRGWGVGIDADIRIPVQVNKGKTATIQFLLKNAGVAWLPSVQRYSADTSFSFSGFTLDQLIDLSDAYSSVNDLSDTLRIVGDTIRSIRFTPAFLQVGKLISEDNSIRVQTFYGARMYPSLVLIPQVYAGLDYRPANWISLGFSGAFGGYTGFRSGLYANMRFKGLNLALASEHIIATVLPSGAGRSLMFRINYRI